MIAFKFPFPPTVNHIWKISAHGGNYLSDKAKAFYVKTSNIILATPHNPFTTNDRIELKITLCRGDQRRYDISNMVKTIEDALVRGAVMPDDSQIDVLIVERGEVSKPNGFCLVELSKL